MPRKSSKQQKYEEIKDSLIAEFGSISGAAESLGFTRTYLYVLMHKGVNSLAFDRIRGRGFDPDKLFKLK